MREWIILDLLYKRGNQPLRMNELITEMNLSERTLQDAIRSLEKAGLNNGFLIHRIRGQGYTLEVTDSTLLENYMQDGRAKQKAAYPADKEERRLQLIRLLLQSNSYQPIDFLAEQLDVSRSTLIADLNAAELALDEFELTLSRRSHYGILVEGGERNFRKAFSRFVLGTGSDTRRSKDFRAFESGFDTDKLKTYMLQQLKEKVLTISDVFLDNIVTHIVILLYRISRQNLIVAGQEVPDIPEPIYLELSRKLSKWIKANYNVSLPEDEILYLALHLSGKTTTEQMSVEKKQQLRTGIADILERLDREFLTRFSLDQNLIDSLVLHMLPLLNRLYYNLQLDNPIVEDIYSEYANAFLISFRFADMIEDLYGFSMSRDEAGYVALHFAAYLERMKQQNLEQYRRIVVICSTGAGSAQLIKLKLETIFPKALVVTASSAEFEEIVKRPVDLILTTIPLNSAQADKPIIHIKQLLDDVEIQRIKELIATRISRSQPSYKLLDFKELFRRELFHIGSSEDYQRLLSERCEEMVELGYAESDFPIQVMMRENKFTTIYKNGVAGPHPMRMSAIRDCIGVTLLDKPVYGADKPVRIVFLINLQPGQLFLHKEISKLLLVLMEREDYRNRLLTVTDYDSFIREMERLL
ncbi:BglG family transcription antiterminator [Paenibacillus massiliensis]|uniref:BglG family transcription antiterminator n=1 Tax=Paenibacillus massiliensis TaxID=225917 RepID=UPI00035C600B|nr:BglG family transcription antiterminator [Paenibacillus massiliensis]